MKTMSYNELHEEHNTKLYCNCETPTFKIVNGFVINKSYCRTCKLPITGNKLSKFIHKIKNKSIGVDRPTKYLYYLHYCETNQLSIGEFYGN